MPRTIQHAKQLLHRSLSVANRPVGAARLRRIVSDKVAAGAPLAIAVGVGRARYPGWISTDVHWSAECYLDLLKPWPVPPGSVARVYGDNVIEHFTVEDGRVVLSHVLAALQPGGTLRLATPDVERTARAYLENSELAQRHLERHRQKGYAVHHPVDLLRVTFAENKHYLGFCYDYAALSAELERAGFVDVRRREGGEADDPAFRQLETRMQETEIATSLVVEARRPPA